MIAKIKRAAIHGRTFNGMLHGSENPVMMALRPTGTPMSTAVYTANVLTSARMAAGMTSRARRPLDEHPAG
ncbi:hypothetical protein ABQJ54_04395 [Rhodanobacter sp. Si-c]|uniref:Uncharacterized protein n=1 Tax=Rhodanobacter lycopersici TaxID=3162487 RepID=A0ABV3QBM1_9GAMM